MQSDQLFLLLVLVVTQIALWSAYKLQIDPKNKYWGRIARDSSPSPSYYLGAAAVAYVLHLFVGGYMVVRDENAQAWHRWTFGVGALVYYVAQMFFIPWLEKANATGHKGWARGLLWFCVVPMLATTVAGVDFARQTDQWWLGALAVLPLLHVAFNDALLFGSKF